MTLVLIVAVVLVGNEIREQRWAPAGGVIGHRGGLRDVPAPLT